MKKLLKLTTGEKTRTMNYIKEDGKIIVLTLVDSNKIKDIEKDPNVEITLVEKDQTTMNVTARINSDTDRVKEVLEQMIEENNSHFKQFTDKLVAIEFTK